MAHKLVISSNLFHWHSGIREFSSEASIMDHELKRQGHTRLSYENGKWGFWMKSERTGREVWFERATEHRQEGELLSVTFRCRDKNLEVNCVIDND